MPKGTKPARKNVRAIHIKKASILTPDLEPGTGLRLSLARQAQGDDDMADKTGEDATKQDTGLSVDASDVPFVDKVLTAIDDEETIAATARAALGGDAVKAEAVVAARRALAQAGVTPDQLAEMSKAPAEPDKFEGVSDEVNEQISARMAAKEKAFDAKLAEVTARMEVREKEAEVAETARKAAEAGRELADLTATARAKFPGLEGKPEEIGARMQRMRAALTEEDYDAMLADWSATSDARQRDLGNKGNGGDGSTTNEESEFEGYIAEMRKENPKLTHAQATSGMRGHSARGKEVYARHMAASASN